MNTHTHTKRRSVTETDQIKKWRGVKKERKEPEIHLIQWIKRKKVSFAMRSVYKLAIMIIIMVTETNERMELHEPPVSDRTNRIPYLIQFLVDHEQRQILFFNIQRSPY